ncbi:MAG: CoA-binding protein [Patescibacteria group bacterium]|nr:CoA-binding protein [Patescibacteria group bacterium]
MEIDQLLTYAVVGASTNPDKYGHKVLSSLLDSGCKVTPINPNADKILGQAVYPNLLSCPDKIDLVIFVVPPKITLQILQEVKDLGISKVWMQPGSESKEAIKFCQDSDIEFVANACIMRAK